jgi:hypothetical protein
MLKDIIEFEKKIDCKKKAKIRRKKYYSSE